MTQFGDVKNVTPGDKGAYNFFQIIFKNSYFKKQFENGIMYGIEFRIFASKDQSEL